ncbi:hypothetical protein AVEN_110934-1 [Araneus ventricosus]|uniref:Uncharacterized protein n=1 Tax=Araneus ventricosus TaxID=182803 RepID=A0A4Y2HD76_ARAVE|nr:hypothetical protein AVEN_110934-1 [Araneus ventricosus]
MWVQNGMVKIMEELLILALGHFFIEKMLDGSRSTYLHSGWCALGHHAEMGRFWFEELGCQFRTAVILYLVLGGAASDRPFVSPCDLGDLAYIS